MNMTERRLLVIFSLWLALGLLQSMLMPSSFAEKENKVLARQTSEKSEVGSVDEKTSEDLGFRVDQLITSLKTGVRPIQILSAKLAGENFMLRLKDMQITGYVNKATRNVIHVTIAGTGRDFHSCTEKLIRLASGGNKSALIAVLARFEKDPQGQVDVDEYFEKDGTRYYLQNISGVPTFHCTNSRADDMAILKARPG